MNTIKNLTIEDKGIGHKVDLNLRKEISPAAQAKVYGLINALIDMVNEIVNSKSENKEIH
jgi:hypothetical protein